MHFQILQHVAYEGPGAISEWIKERNHSFSVTHVYQDQNLPEPRHFDGLIILGGPMGINDLANHAWLEDEKKLIQQSIDCDKIVLGICLGAQLLAESLGSKVIQAQQKEIGWFPIELTRDGRHSALFSSHPNVLSVFHWHGDTFELPSNAKLLAKSEACPNQAFQFGNKILGLQYHLEVKPENVRTMAHHGDWELTEGPFVQTAGDLVHADSDYYYRMHSVLYKILDQWSSCGSV